MRFCKRAAILIGALVGDRRQKLVQQIAVRAMQFERVEAEPLGAFRGARQTHRGCARAPPHRARAAALRLGLCGTADGPSVCQPPSESGINWPPSHGVWLDALRPACASCIATAIFECLRTEATIGFSAASVASFHSPRQPGVMRPIASTCGGLDAEHRRAGQRQRVDVGEMPVIGLAVDSAEYWHIGATMMRLGKRFRPRN